MLLRDVVVEHQAEALAVLGDVGDAVRRSALRMVPTSTSLPCMQHLAADALAVGAAEHAHRELGAARAHQPGDADDLAAPHVQVHALDQLRGRACSGWCTRQSRTSNTVSPIFGVRCG